MKKFYFMAAALVLGVMTASAVDGALPGRFTINAEGDTVHFSKGNLYYEYSETRGTFRFSDDQYVVMEDGWPHGIWSYRSLFGFGTSGWKNSGAVAYNPADTSRVASDYLIGGSAENGLTGDYAYADWGIYNSIENGGQMAGLWRTLSMDEWVYILAKRENAQQLFTTGRVKWTDDWDHTNYTINGMILLPDNWVKPEGVIVLPVTKYGWELDYTPGDILYHNSNLDLNTYTLNTYTLEQWKLMEAAGAVFLPAAGYRDGSEVKFVGTDGCYLSSTPHGNGVCSLEFTSGNSSLETPWYSRAYGYSVRLVTRPENDKQGIDQTPSGSPSRGEKVLRNGMLYLKYEGRMYDVQGREVK
jgi:hypothetical protein